MSSRRAEQWKIKDDDLEGALREKFKLSGYEARTYLALVRLGKQTAKQISSSANVPLPRMYDILESLMAKGFAMKQEDAFSPISPRRALGGRISQFELQFAQEQAQRQLAEKYLSRALELLASALSPTAKSKNVNKEGEVSIVRGVNSIANVFSELIARSGDIILVAKRAIEARDIFLPILLRFRSESERRAIGRSDRTGSRRKRQRLRIIVPQGTQISEGERVAIKRTLAEVRESDRILFDVMVTESDDVLIGVPDPLSKEANNAIAMWVRNVSFARSTKASIEDIWRVAARVVG